LVNFFSVLSCEFDVLDVHDENFYGLDVLSNLFVDAKSLFEELVFFLFGNISELKTVVVVESVDVIHNTTSFRSNSSQNEQVLEIAVFGEIRVVQNDALEKFDKLVGELSIDESAHGDCDLVNIFGLREGSLDNLINDLLSVGVFFNENFTPKLS